MPKTAPTPTQHHYIRTYLASLCGALAVTLLFVSVVLVWLNNTVTNTGTYMHVVGPLVDKPAIQTYVAEQASTQIVKGAPIQDAANTLLTPDEVAGRTPEQLQPLVKAKVYTAVLQIVRSPQFAASWKQTNRTAHAALVAQLNAKDPQNLALDLSPIMTTVTDQLKQTQLAPLAAQLTAEPAHTTIGLKGSIFDIAASYYHMFLQALWALIAIVVLLFVLAVTLSVHHLKTLRRILIMSGIVALGIAVLLQVPSFVPLGGGSGVEQKAIAQLARSLFSSLQLFCLLFGLTSIAAAIGSKIYTARTATLKK